jgi:hypothetical protein
MKDFNTQYVHGINNVTTISSLEPKGKTAIWLHGLKTAMSLSIVRTRHVIVRQMQLRPFAGLWKRGQAPANGDCFFESVATCLRNSDQEQHHTAKELRACVAASITLYNPVLERWRDLLTVADHESHREMMYLEPLRRCNKIDLQVVNQIQTNMMNPSIYWADQYAVQTVAEALQIAIVVRTSRSALITPRAHPYPKALSLYLSHNHYEPLLYKAQGVVDSSLALA